MFRRLWCVLWLFGFANIAIAKGVYLTVEQFIDSAFDAKQVKSKMLWFKGEHRKKLETVLNHPLGVRSRYWISGTRTAWIFEEIGKELPITIGVVVDSGHIVDLRILAFRESRGWEVRYPYFTQQFVSLRLTNDTQLSGPIDGISGATLSVDAVTRAARAALLSHSMVP